MSKWVRVKDDSGIERVSLIVRRDTDPEVYEWLQGIPYGKANAYIKAALKYFVLKEGPGDAFSLTDRVTSPSQVSPAPPERIERQVAPVSQPSALQASAPPRTGIASPDQPESQLLQEIDPDTLAVMREMNGRF